MANEFAQYGWWIRLAGNRTERDGEIDVTTPKGGVATLMEKAIMQNPR